MNNRIELQTILETILGSRNVYYQPPENYKISYPAIIYFRNPEAVRHADDMKYLQTKLYEITLIDKNPDSEYIDKILKLPMSKHTNHMVVDYMHHDYFELYF